MNEKVVSPATYPIYFEDIKSSGLDPATILQRWPFSEKEYSKLRKKLFSFLSSKVLESNDEKESEIYTVLSAPIFHIADTIHLLGVKERLGKDQEYISLNTSRAPSPEKFNIDSRPLPEPISHKEYIKAMLRSWQFRQKREYQKDLLVIERPFGFFEDYAQKQQMNLLYKDLRIFSPKKTFQEYPLQIGQYSEELAVFLKDLFREHNVSVAERFTHSMIKYYEGAMSSTSHYINELERKVKSISFEELGIQSFGYLPHRALAMASKRQGKKTIGFFHGYEASALLTDTTDLNFYYFGIYDKFLSSSPYSTHIHELRSHLSSPVPTSFENLDSNYFLRELKNINYGAPKKLRDLKKIMFVDAGLFNRRFSLAEPFWTLQVKTVKDLSQFLREHGYITQLKIKSVEGGKHSQELYSDCFDEFLFEPFEKTMEKTDAFFCPFTMSSSTFVPALFSGKPVFVLECMLRFIVPSERDKIKNCCIVVPSKFINEDNEIEIDFESFSRILSKEEINFSSGKSYLEGFFRT